MNDVARQVNAWMAAGKDGWATAIQQIRDLHIDGEGAWQDYFRALKQRALYGWDLDQLLLSDPLLHSMSLDELQRMTHLHYEDILPSADGYEAGFASPDYAVRMFGEGLGQLMSAFYLALRNFRYYVRLGHYTSLKQNAELLLHLVELWRSDKASYEILLKEYRDHALSDTEMSMLSNYYQRDPGFTLYRDILESSDFTDPRYLYRFGIRVDAAAVKMAKFIAAYPEPDLRGIAQYLVNAFLISFERKGQDYRKKKHCNVLYPLGMERLALMVMEAVRQNGLEPVVGSPMTKGVNQQLNYDSRFDSSLYYDQEVADMNLRISKEVCNRMEEVLANNAGPLYIELFGEEPFVPVPKATALRNTPEQDMIQRRHMGEFSQFYFTKFPRETTSFTIIAFPSPAVGDRFEDIFRDTLELNYLDSDLYASIQENIITVLDQAQYVHVKGVPGNETDIRVTMHPITDPAKQTNFENCVADVNIPVGEVFTSPMLSGTDGTLHVADIFLNNLRFLDLKVTFKDGMVSDYSCANFPDAEQNRKYIHENLLRPHDTLPIGEFAIGTNTKAYKMAKKYGIQYMLPILIIEKMGPHFAIGDTCFSHEEDTDHLGIVSKKLIIAVDNEMSRLRDSDPQKAYTQKHCDITLPYDMLQEIAAVKADGTRIPIIQNGRFVVPGTEELNEALD